MTSAQTLIVLEVEEGVTADEINQKYEKRDLKGYNCVVDVLTTFSSLSRALVVFVITHPN
jgi:hypothetical protein